MRSLWQKQLLAFLIVSLLGVGLVAVLANQAIGSAFGSYVQRGASARARLLQVALADYYAQTGTWQGVEPLLATGGSEAPGLGQDWAVTTWRREPAWLPARPLWPMPTAWSSSGAMWEEPGSSSVPPPWPPPCRFRLVNARWATC